MRNVEVGGLFAMAAMVVTIAAARAEGPSFSCERVKTSIERAICGNQELSSQDLALAKLFKEAGARMEKPAADAFRRNQVAWLSERDRACAADHDDSLAKLYEERIDALHALLARVSDENPDLGRRDPAALWGEWTVESVGPPRPRLNPIV